MIDSLSHGDIALIAPLFDEYIKRFMPVWSNMTPQEAQRLRGSARNFRAIGQRWSATVS